ncbi:MAG: tRNA pseudouridine(38-40) synthase TruA [Gammaproteobacteria bacterium]|nr:tRNA pseudouridine(38-40) synthase TruA [Gammaproteobacteria bacterium]
MRFAGIVEYDGSDFCGWQRQLHVPSVQETVERAISLVANHEVGIACAGRTDTGVHALGQVMHFDTNANRDLRSWLLGINANLPPSVVLRSIKPMPEDFHARFSALSRTYRYIIANEKVRSALLAKRAVWERLPLQADLMQEGANYLVGEHDFTSFRALSCQAKSPIREISNFRIHREGALIIMDVTANGFLHHMVRNLAGVLMSIGKNENSPQWAQRVLMKKDRACGGVTAPAQGLYFMSVLYEQKYQL